MKKQVNIEEIYKRIKEIKSALQDVDSMRPGNVNKQFKDPKKKTGGYYQLNYTHKMKTHTEYIRKTMLSKIRAETEEYKKFKTLIDEWITLSIMASKLEIREALKKKVKNLR